MAKVGIVMGSDSDTVSYTHLDVYKRQSWDRWAMDFRRQKPENGHF